MPLILPGLLAALALSPTADAADFSGRIRRIRIRENNAGTDFKTVVSTESGDPNDPGSLSVTVSGLETGIQSTLTGRARKTRVLATATASWAGRARPIETKYTMTAQMRPVDDPTTTTPWTLELPLCEADCEWVEEVFEDGTVAGARLTVSVDADGNDQLTADLRLVPGDQVTWTYGAVRFGGDDLDGDGSPDDVVEADLGEGPRYRTKWVTPAWDAALTDSAVQLDATLTNPDGSTDRLLDLAVLRLDDESGLVEATIKPRRKGGYKVNLWTQSTPSAPIASVFTEISDSDSDEVLAELDIDAPVETTAILAAPLTGTLAGERVAATLALYAGDEALLTEVFNFVNSEGLLTLSFAQDSALALSKAGVFTREDGSTELAFSVTGSDADQVTAAVVVLASRTFEGSIDSPVESLHQRWTDVIHPGTDPEVFGVDAEVRDGEGTALDGWNFDIQALFGSGTRGTAVRATTRTTLL